MNIELQEIDWDLFKNSVTHLPGTGVVMRDFIKSKNIPDSIVISQLTIDPDYVNTLNISVVTGKDFQAYSKTNPGNLAMINESAVSLLGYREPGDAVGQNITIGSTNSIQIIGVVKDFVIQSADYAPDPLVLRVIPKYYNYALVKFSPGQDINTVIASLEKTWKELNPEQLFRYRLYSDYIEEYQQMAMQVVKSLGFITFLTIFISILGLLGMVVFNNESRINEIGIRKVMGATNREVLWTISRSFVYMMTLAGLIATPAAWFLGNMILQNSYNRIKLEPGFFVFGILFLLIIGMTTVFSQTWKAANRNPVDALYQTANKIPNIILYLHKNLLCEF
ncbi:hypothetical protein ES705_33966 [subsurface metagenome]